MTLTPSSASLLSETGYNNLGTVGANTMTSQENSFETIRVAILCSALLLIFLASCVGNGLVFLVFFKKRSLLTLSNRFILNLSVCNITTSLFLTPVMFTSVLAKEWLFGQTWCQVTGFLMNTVFAASTLTLVSVSIDRYCAVVNPLHYNLTVTSKRSLLIIIGVWIVAVAASLPPLFGWNKYTFQVDKCTCTVRWAAKDEINKYYTLCLVVLTFIFPLLVILLAYIAIFKSAKKNLERTRRNSIIPNNSIDENCNAPLNEAQRRRSSTAPILIRRLSASSRNGMLMWKKDEWKAAVTILLVVFTFIVCWFLYFIIIVLESVLSLPEMINPELESASIVLAVSSCAFNPWVYVFRNKAARQELLLLLRCRVRDRDNFVTDSRRGSTCASVRGGIVRQESTDSEVSDKPLHTSSTSTTLTSLLQTCGTPPVRL